MPLFWMREQNFYLLNLKKCIMIMFVKNMCGKMKFA